VIKSVIVLLLGSFLVVSCAPTKQLYNWKGYDAAVYGYIKKSDEERKGKLLQIYMKLINTPDGTRLTPPPGVCADYGYLLIKDGKVEQGKEFLVKETVFYPESKPFIDRILKRFEK
jgi:hypothetical protein